MFVLYTKTEDKALITRNQNEGPNKKMNKMKTRIFLTALLLLGCSSAIVAGNCIDNLSRSIARLPEAQTVNINPFVMNLIKPFSSEMKGVKSMNIVSAEDISTADYTRLKKLIEDCQSEGYETIISSNEDGEIARILMKMEKDKIREIVILSLEEDEANLIRIKGAIDPKQLNEIIENNK